MSSGYGNLSPEERASIDAAMSGTPVTGGNQPRPVYDWPNPQTQNAVPSMTIDQATALLALIDQIPNLPEMLKARYKQAVGRYIDALRDYDATPPNQRYYQESDKAVTLALQDLKSVEGQIEAYLPQPPKAAPQATPYRPGEAEGVELSNVGKDLANQKARRDLQSPWAVAIQQAEEAIDAIANNPRFNLAEANKQIDLVWQNVNAMLEGTTPFAKSEAKLKREDEQRKQQQSLAQNLISDRLQVGSNMAQGLLGGLTNAFKGVYSRTKPSYNYNVFDLANAYMDQNQGGGELNDLARAVLSGALRNKEQV